MIASKELRQGNIIGWRTGFGDLITGQVYEVHADKVAIGPETIIDDNSSGQGFMTLKGIEPININQEWLIKLGFIKSETAPYKDQLAYEIFTDAQRIFWCADNLFKKHQLGFIQITSWDFLDDTGPIKHIHRVQNAIYFLTGKELKVI